MRYRIVALARFFIAAAVTSFIFPQCARAQEQFREIWRVGNWNGYLFTSPLGSFDRCTTVVHYTNGYTLGFSVDRNAKILMRLTGESSGLTPGATSNVDMQIDGQSYGSVLGTNSANNQTTYDLGSRSNLLRALRRGNKLTLTTRYPLDFSLANSSQALRRMAECIPGPAMAGNTSSNSRRGVASAPLPPDTPPGMFAYDQVDNPFNDVARALEDD